MQTNAGARPDQQIPGPKALLTIFAVFAAVVGLIYLAAAESREWSRHVIASAEFQECERYLSRHTTPPTSKTQVNQYCYALHYGRRPHPELAAMMAGRHQCPLTPKEFQERYLTPGCRQVPAANKLKE